MKITNMLSKSITAVTFVVIICAASITVPKIFGIMPCVVLSGSMEPAIQTGAVAFINTNDTDSQAGDIITYQLADGKLVTHRVVRRLESGELITKGDANEAEDNVPVITEQVVGTYLFQIPQAGYLLAVMDQKHMAMLVFWIIFLNTVSYCISRAAERKMDEGHGNPNP